MNRKGKIIEPSGRSQGGMPVGQGLRHNIAARRQRGTLYRTLLLSSVVLALAVLTVLLYDIVDTSFGYVAVQNRIEPEQLTGGRPLQELEKDELVAILRENDRG